MGRKLLYSDLGLLICCVLSGCQTLDIIEQDSAMLVDMAFDGAAEVSWQVDQAIHQMRYGY
jgi:hypothetical protein